MKLKPSASFVKKSLSSHSWMGLFVGALMYLICLTGTLVVFFEEFERWEQPKIEEYSDYSPELINKAIEQFLQKVKKVPESLYFVFPTDAVPRAHIAGDDKEWFVNVDGVLSESPIDGWTYLLKELHINLHLPQTLGLIVVGIFGVMLCSLIISGLFAHPKIFKDAFRLRWGGSKHLAQADLHNRLGVWGIPFYFMIGMTGAFIGLAGLFITIGAMVFFDNDRTAAIDAVYGQDPVIEKTVQAFDFSTAMTTLKSIQPDAKPIYLVVQKMHTKNQFVEIAASLPGRLVYSEIYRFEANGKLINYQHLSDGPVGRQIAYSVYRLHFGHFDHFIVKILYGILGLSLSIICVTGINIWLVKRKFSSFLNDCWVAIVWGIPLSLSCAAITNIMLNTSLLGFLLAILFSFCISHLLKNVERSRLILIGCLSLSLFNVGLLHIDKFGSSHQLSMMINGIIMLIALGFMVYVMMQLWLSKKLVELPLEQKAI